MKKIIVMVLTIIMMTYSIAYASVDVQINGEVIDFTDTNGSKVEAQIINDRTMVPMRKIFEIFDCTVTWNSEDKSIVATKNDIEVKLQIGNTKAYKIQNNIEKEITLDSAPVIVNDRTLVPLRFIAESLEKQVGWDKSAYTAVIIDYSYFVEKLKNDSDILYDMLNNNEDKNYTVNLTRKYLDDDTNNTFNVTATINETSNINSKIQNVNIKFSGNSELVNEIISEGWSDINYSTEFKEDSVKYSTTNATLSKMFDIDKIGIGEEEYTSLKLDGASNINIEKMMQLFANVDESDITISTFESLEKSYNNLKTMLNIKNNDGVCGFNANINYENANRENFDLARLDNIIFDNAIIRTYNFLNKKIFNFDVNIDELLYDTSSINLNGSISENKIEIKYKSSNDYNENIEYEISILK